MQWQVTWTINNDRGERTPCLTSEGVAGFCSEPTSCKVDLNRSDCSESEVCCGFMEDRVDTIFKTRLKRSSPVPIPNLRVKGCGVRKTMTDFVVGGNEAQFWPWMVAIFVKRPGSNSNRFLCGGTVITKNLILTAAHCLGQTDKAIPAELLSVHLGGLTQEGDGQEYLVSETVIHEDYRNHLHYDDIALLKLSRNIESKDVLPACLPTPGMYDSNFTRRNTTVIGWGVESFGGKMSRVLKEALAPVKSNSKCEARYKRLGSLSLPRGIVDTQICAGTKDGSSDACQGDSGGPLLVEDKSLKWNVVGIVSFGYQCGHPEYPGVYTRVSRYLPWLRDNTDIPARYS